MDSALAKARKGSVMTGAASGMMSAAAGFNSKRKQSTMGSVAGFGDTVDEEDRFPGLKNVALSGEQVHELFVLSKMLVLDEMTTDKHKFLTFVDFMEFFARFAYRQALQEHENPGGESGPNDLNRKGSSVSYNCIAPSGASDPNTNSFVRLNSIDAGMATFQEEEEEGEEGEEEGEMQVVPKGPFRPLEDTAKLLEEMLPAFVERITGRKQSGSNTSSNRSSVSSAAVGKMVSAVTTSKAIGALGAFGGGKKKGLAAGGVASGVAAAALGVMLEMGEDEDEDGDEEEGETNDESNSGARRLATNELRVAIKAADAARVKAAIDKAEELGLSFEAEAGRVALAKQLKKG
jgi:hypothetical protein